MKILFRWFENLNIKYKLLLTLLPFFIAGSLVISYYTYNIVLNQTTENINREIEQIIKLNKNDLTSDIVGSLFQLKQFAGILNEKNSVSKDKLRSYYALILKGTLQANPLLLTTWATFEPNKFDGNDAAYIDKEYSTKKGVYSPYWVRSGNQIELTKSNDIEEDNPDFEFYTVPKQKKELFLTEPYKDPDTKILMASICLPLFERNDFIGVAGFDFSMDKITEKVTNIHLFKTGFAILITEQGNIIGYKDNSLIGKSIDELIFFKPLKEKISSQLQNKDKFIVTSQNNNEEFDYYFDRIYISNNKTKWFSVFAIPYESIIKSNTDFIWTLLIINIGFLILFSAIVFFSANEFTKELIKARDVIIKISKGLF